MALKHVVLSVALHNVAAGVGTALPPYKHRRGFFARGGGFRVRGGAPRRRRLASMRAIPDAIDAKPTSEKK